MATPPIPPRPSRSQAGAHVPSPLTPIVPPRPARRTAQSTSPTRDIDHYPRSPLNDSPFAQNVPYHAPGSSNDLRRIASLNASQSALEEPERPPSRSIPTIGEEGMEYADLPTLSQQTTQVSNAEDVKHTGTVAGDLPLHAPTARGGQSDAKAKLAAVTAQSSRVGNGEHGDHDDNVHRPLRSSQSFSRPMSASSHERPGSAQLDEHGIPMIGMQVPLLGMAGDVQAPSPSPFPGSADNTGALFRVPSAQGKRKSRDISHAPPGSYGLHGHAGHHQQDQFEKAWHQKHPEANDEDHGNYTPAIIEKPEWALSSEELNKIVHDTARGAGFGTSKTQVPMPNEQIGYLASEEYVSRMSTPKTSRPVSQQQGGQGHGGVPEKDLQKALAETTILKAQRDRQAALATPGLVADDDGNIIHIDAPLYRETKVGPKMVDGAIDLGPDGGNTDEHGGWVEETGYGVPILASDEVEPGAEYLQPAIPPHPERPGSAAGHEFEPLSRTGSRSQPVSRPGSIHGVPTHLRPMSAHEDNTGAHTPLEDVLEYEPLFPDEGKDKPMTPLERIKSAHAQRSSHALHRFPSQDIWEDTPNSLQLQTYVETPEPKREGISAPPAQRPHGAKSTFETADQEARRKGVATEQQRAMLMSKDEQLAKSNFKPHLLQEVQAGRQSDGHRLHRFPSQDIWEDSPDSVYLHTTVGDTPVLKAEDDVGLAAGAVVKTTSGPTVSSQDKGATTEREGAIAGQPVVPPRPIHPKHHHAGGVENVPSDAPLAGSEPTESQASSSLQKVVSNDSKSAKPVVPPRPAKKPTPPAIGTSRDTASPPDAAASAKPKPAIPARPAGNKIAALQAGFMSDLNKKLGLGPREPPKPAAAEEDDTTGKDEDEDKAPLSDARKGRARGPARRKPTASPSATSSTAPATKIEGWTAVGTMGKDGRIHLNLAQPINLLELRIENGEIFVPDGVLKQQGLEPEAIKQEQAKQTESEKSAAPIVSDLPHAAGTNTAGESVHPPPVKPEALAATAISKETAPAATAEAHEAGEPEDLGHAAQGASSSSAAEAIQQEKHKLAGTVVDVTVPEADSAKSTTQNLDEDAKAPVHKVKSQDQSVQTGEKVVEMGFDGDKDQKKTITTIDGGDAQKEGFVVQGLQNEGLGDNADVGKVVESER